MGKSAYIVTKPLQYVNATNILDSNNKDCFIVGNFNNFQQFVTAIKTTTHYWDNIFILSTKNIAILKIIFHKKKYSKIFLDSDFGVIVRLLLFLLHPLNIYVYEEGLASYYPFLRPNKSLKDKILRKIDFFMGGKTWSGGAFMTTGIYLYHIEAFRLLVNDENINKKLLNFNSDFISHIMSLKEIDYLCKDLDFYRFQNKNIIIYITAGKINNNCFSILKDYPNHIKILKLHPSEKYDFQCINEFDYSLNNTIPAEVLLCKLHNISKSIVVIHEGSAGMLNILHLGGLVEYNIGNTSYTEKYEEIKRSFLYK